MRRVVGGPRAAGTGRVIRNKDARAREGEGGGTRRLPPVRGYGDRRDKEGGGEREREREREREPRHGRREMLISSRNMFTLKARPAGEKEKGERKKEKKEERKRKRRGRDEPQTA